MNFSKTLLCLIASLVLVSNINSREICLEFGQNDNYKITCCDNSKSFTSLSDFSKELNGGITGNLFKSTSIEKNGDTLIFNDISNSEPCNLTLKSVNTFRPRVFFNFGDNKAHFLNLIVDNSIDFFSIDYDSSDNVKIDRLQIESSSTKFRSNSKQVNLNSFTVGPNAEIRLNNTHISIKKGYK